MSHLPTLVERMRQLAITEEADQLDDSSMSSFRFNDLPAELKLNILSKLPAKEIQHARRLSKGMRNLIDLEDNRTLLVTEACKTALAAIQDYHDNIIDFDPVNTDALQLLRQVTRLREGFYMSHSNVAAIWAHHYGLDHWETRRLSSTLQSLMLLNCIRNLYNRPTQSGHPMRFGPDEWLRSEAQFMARYATDRIWNDHERTGLSRAMLQDMYIRVHEDNELALAVVRDDSQRPEEWLKLTNGIHGLPFVFDYRIREICDILHLPRIPMHLIEHIGISVRTQWAHDKVVGMLEDGETATDLQRVAIQEELFLF